MCDKFRDIGPESREDSLNSVEQEAASFALENRKNIMAIA